MESNRDRYKRYMEEEDKIEWDEFRINTTDRLENKYYKLIMRLHAKYFNHKYQELCTCSPKRIKQWITHLNDIYDKENT
jgi:hypothetical protein